MWPQKYSKLSRSFTTNNQSLTLESQNYLLQFSTYKSANSRKLLIIHAITAFSFIKLLCPHTTEIHLSSYHNNGIQKNEEITSFQQLKAYYVYKFTFINKFYLGSIKSARDTYNIWTFTKSLNFEETCVVVIKLHITTIYSSSQ